MTMLRKLGGVVGKLVSGIFMAIGIAVVTAIGLIWWNWGGEKKPPEPVAQVEAATPGDACACAAGAWCEGPRGGSYCLDAGGKKRYRAK